MIEIGVFAHEFGHAAAGLNDEYFDAVGCKLLVIDPNANKLDAKYMGSDPHYPNTDPAYCSGIGTKCPADVQVTCYGNNPITPSGSELKASDGTYSRCIMSLTGLPTPRTFCQECLDKIRKVPELNCGP